MTRGSALGVGMDLAEVARVRRSVERTPAILDRFLTAEEKSYCLAGRNKYERIAARFAAKEAVIKALDRTGLPLKSIRVSRAASGRPEVTVAGLKGARILLSMTHTRGYACAVAIALKK